MHDGNAPRRPRAAGTPRRLAALALAGLALAACARIVGDSEGVLIRHTAHQPVLADIEAKQHCAEYGREAVKVRMGPIEPGPLAIQTRVSEYECVAPGEAPAN